MAHLASLGMRMLANADAVIECGDDALVVAGLTGPSARSGRARESADHGVALCRSGHTHGGMIVGLDHLDHLVARGNRGSVSGHDAVGDMALYVNNGTGIWPGFALRWGKPSELTRITLRRRAC